MVAAIRGAEDIGRPCYDHTLMTSFDARHADRAAIWDAVPRSYENRKTAAEIADRAGVNRRSCGTKLSAMSVGGYQRLGLRREPDDAGRQMLWWREDSVAAENGERTEVPQKESRRAKALNAAVEAFRACATPTEAVPRIQFVWGVHAAIEAFERETVHDDEKGTKLEQIPPTKAVPSRSR